MFGAAFPPFSTLSATSTFACGTIAGKSWEEGTAVTVSWRIVRNITIQPNSIDRERLLCKVRQMETFRGILTGMVAWTVSLKIEFPTNMDHSHRFHRGRGLDR